MFQLCGTKELVFINRSFSREYEKNKGREYMFLLGGNFMPGTEKLCGELLFPEETMVVVLTKGRKTIFSEGNKCSSQSFFDPGIMFSA